MPSIFFLVMHFTTILFSYVLFYLKFHQTIEIKFNNIQQTGGMQKPLPLNQQQLSRSWDVSQRSTAADWNEWLRRLNVDLLKESPSPALRCCSALAQAYTPLARDLFHAAFVSCWHELSDQYQDSLVSMLHPLFYFLCISSLFLSLVFLPYPLLFSSSLYSLPSCPHPILVSSGLLSPFLILLASSPSPPLHSTLTSSHTGESTTNCFSI